MIRNVHTREELDIIHSIKEFIEEIIYIKKSYKKALESIN